MKSKKIKTLIAGLLDMYCRECGKKCGKTICKECEDNIKRLIKTLQLIAVKI